MSAARRSSIAAGTLFLLGIATVFTADAFRPALTGADYLTGVADHSGRLAVAALFYLGAAASSLGIAVALYPLVRPVSAAQAVGAVAFRTVEAAFYTVAVVGLLSLLPLARQLPTAPADQRGTLRLLADALVAQRDHATVVAVFAFCVGALLYYLPLYRARLVPRWLSGWGVIAVVLLLTACLLALFTDSAVTGYALLAAPIALQEITLGLWLLIRGASPSTSAMPDDVPAALTHRVVTQPSSRA